MATSRFFLSTVAVALLLPSLGFVNTPDTPKATFPLQALGLTQAANASENSVYKPPIRPRPTSRTNGTGSRGCNRPNQPVSLNLLVPEGHIGQTVSARPTFLWAMTNANAARFTLVEQGVPTPLVDKIVQAPEMKTSGSGIMALEIPADAPELSLDKEYRWTVSVLCNPNRPSDAVSFTQSFVVRVVPSAEVQSRLQAAKTSQERARIYADAGYWYDALTEFSKAASTDPAAKQEMLSLLEQVGLKDAASTVTSNGNGVARTVTTP